MSHSRSSLLSTTLRVLTAVVILKVTAAVVAGYRNYLPPNFQSDFLRGREAHFVGPYQWAFNAHIAAGPCALVLGLILLSNRFRLRFPAWHRVLGRIQVANVLLLVVPSGFWMANYAAAGPIAAAGFAGLALATGATITLGWRTAVQRKFLVHRRWMVRNYVLLCSAVVLRVVVGAATVLGVDVVWFDPLVSWACWLVPLALYELLRGRQRGRILSAVAARAMPAANY
jgi:hypothetical protein